MILQVQTRPAWRRKSRNRFNISRAVEFILDGNLFNLFQSRVSWRKLLRNWVGSKALAEVWGVSWLGRLGGGAKKKFLLVKLSRYEDSSCLSRPLLCISEKVIIGWCWRSKEREQQERGKKSFPFSKLFAFCCCSRERSNPCERYLFQYSESERVARQN